MGSCDCDTSLFPEGGGRVCVVLNGKGKGIKSTLIESSLANLPGFYRC